MNANELADLKEFEKMLSVGYLPAVKQAIEMLCQQQAEIEALKLSCPKCGGVTGKLEVLNVPTKTLTDEEILECWNETHPAVVMLNAELPLFARAILRKAQEK